ncbi:MAG: TrkH family potassium uptake protein [Marinosulfonomonas sp.]
MLRRVLALPFIIILMGVGAIAMFVPAFHAAALHEHHVARSFFFSGLLFLTITAFIGIAVSNNTPSNQNRSHLLAILAVLAVLPLMLAFPFYIAVGNTSFLNSYVEMVSSITTTGATLFDDPNRLPQSVHLWRALVAWLGGFFILVSAIAIMAPMSLGGFEVLSSGEARFRAKAAIDVVWISDGSERLKRYTSQLFPIYASLTAVLWLFLLVLGDSPLVALCHAMSTLSTSGISPVGGLHGGGSGWGGEIVIFLFMIFAFSRQTFSPDQVGGDYWRILRDPEFKMGVFLVLFVTVLLFLRHWIGALEVNELGNARAAIEAFWGALFSVMSFLTTTGFESVDWNKARDWSGLASPGIVLLGMCLIGGGVATTAGGVKLLRVYALYKHGAREMERIIHPTSVGGAGSAARRLRRQGAYAAWVFFMLYTISITVGVLAFSLTGQSFESSMVFSIAALSTTGPVADNALGHINSYGTLNEAAKYILAVGMVLGRLETLAIIALFNPNFWRS